MASFPYVYYWLINVDICVAKYLSIVPTGTKIRIKDQDGGNLVIIGRYLALQLSHHQVAIT